ncbi:MAG: hypothetical protein VYD05_01755, partial [Planctomycetota bacterium]|nr:hypothetical protein [Planctomycetota bacterium]
MSTSPTTRALIGCVLLCATLSGQARGVVRTIDGRALSGALTVSEYVLISQLAHSRSVEAVRSTTMYWPGSHSASGHWRS